MHTILCFHYFFKAVSLVFSYSLCPLIMQSLLEKGYDLVSGGTDNHLVLVNLRNKVKGDSSFLY